MNRKQRRANAKTEGNASTAFPFSAAPPRPQPHSDAPARLQQAVALHRQGKLAEAEVIYATLAEIPATRVDALHMLGMVRDRQGRRDEAVKLITQALAIAPFAEGYSNLGNVLMAQGNMKDAAKALEHAVTLKPHFAQAWNNLANVRKVLGEMNEALRCYREALRIDPKFDLALANLGVLHMDEARYDEAEQCFSAALVINPQNLQALNNIAYTLFQRHRPAEAVARYEDALNVAPDQPALYTNMATALHRLGRIDEARAAYDRAYALAPAESISLRRALLVPPLMRSETATAALHAQLQNDLEALLPRLRGVDDPLRDVGQTLFFLSYAGKNDRDIAALLARCYLTGTSSLAMVAPHCSAEKVAAARREMAVKPRRLRIGICSEYFYRHTISKLMHGIVAHLPRDRFEVVLIRTPGPHDAMAAAMDAVADRVVHIPKILAPARERIAQERLDILFYADIGMDPFTYLLAFARLAPVQCVTWGHPDTTGIPNMDYFLSSALIEPEGAEDHYTEQLVRLARLPACYTRPQPPALQKTRADFGLPEEARLYLCPQTLFKIHPEFDVAMAAILERDERALIVLIEGLYPEWTQALTARFGAAYPQHVARLKFLPRMTEESFLSLLTLADAMLDPWHFGGGNSSYEAFALGVPIITWPREHMRGRVTLGCYRLMGMEDLVAQSGEEYISLALRLAQDAPWNKAMRARILERSGAIYDDREAVAELADFFERAYSGSAVLPVSKPSSVGGGGLGGDKKSGEKIEDKAPPPLALPSVSPVQAAMAESLVQRADFLLIREHKAEEAIPLYRQALALHPGHVLAHEHLGGAYYAQKRFDEAIASYREALRLDPHYAVAHKNLGMVYYTIERLEESEQSYREALRYQPDAGIEIRLGLLHRPFHPSRAAMMAHRERIAGNTAALRARKLSVADHFPTLGQTNFYLAYHGENDRELQRQIAQLYLEACPALGKDYRLPAGGDVVQAARPIRLMFVSSHLFAHTVARLMEGLITHLPRERFEITVVHFGEKEDETTARIARAVDRFLRPPKTLPQAREQMAQARPDIVFYLDIGMDPFTYFLAFARLAPVQCVTWGHPDTTGIPNMDYFLSPDLCEPEGGEQHYSEKLVRLPALPVYYARPVLPVRLPRVALGLPEDATLYLCPQMLFKLHPEFDAVLADILRRDPKGRIVLIESHYPHWTAMFRERFARAHDDVAARIIFLKPMPRDSFLALLALADVMLDPIHFGGGNTTFEALGLNVPLVTWPGEFMRGRVTLGCYRLMGMEELIAPSKEAYAALAVRAATDPAWNSALRAAIAERSGVLFDNPAGARALAGWFLHIAGAGS